MSARRLPVVVLLATCALGVAQQPAYLPPPPVRLGPPVATTPGAELPPLLAVPAPAPAPRKHCRSCANDYNPSHVYLPDQNPDFGAGGCDGDCHPCRMGWINLAFFCGKAEDLGLAERRSLYGVQAEAGYWLNYDRTVGVQIGFLTSHASFREAQGGPVLIDAPVTITTLDASLRTELFVTDHVRVDGLVGYQYVQFHEKLLTANLVTASNQDARNEVHGGRVGLVGDYRYGAYFAGVLGAVGVGRNETTVTRNGVRTTDSVLCIVPEFGARVGYQLGEAMWITFGYTFLYLSDVQRPGVGQTDFYMHGVALGCEKRF